MAVDAQTVRIEMTDNEQWRVAINNFSKNKHVINCHNDTGIKEAYQKCDVVRTVIGESANAIANLKVWALDDNGKEDTSRLAREIIYKLKQPNPKQSFKLFFRELDLFCKLYGKAYVRKFKNSVGGTDYYVIPNDKITVEYENTTNLLLYRNVRQYRIEDSISKPILLKPEEVHVFYDGTLSESYSGDEIYGGSRLASLSEQISTYYTAWEVLCGLYGEGGARNLIFLGQDDINRATSTIIGDEKKSLYEILKYRFGGRRGQDKDAIISGKGGVARLTAPITEMDIVNNCIMAKKSICNAYGYPPELMGTDAPRYKLYTEAIRKLYTQSALPSFEYYAAEWLIMVGAINVNFTITGDYSHLDFYREAQKDEAIAWQSYSQAINTLVEIGVISKEEARIKLGY